MEVIKTAYMAIIKFLFIVLIWAILLSNFGIWGTIGVIILWALFKGVIASLVED
jgi:uncharacterized membrane protein